ncbi:MAG: O-antigen ligase family protein [Candidatus Muiribacteriota bacterium]
MNKSVDFYINKIIVYFLYFVVFTTPLVFSKYTKQNFLEAKEFFLIFCVSILIFINTIYMCYRTKGTDFWVTPLAKVVMLFILSMIISSLFSINYYMSIDRFLKIIIYFIIMWVAYENFKSFEDLSDLFFLTIVAGGVVSAYGIFQYFGIDPFFPPGQVLGNEGRLRIFSTFGNPNFLADYLVLPFPIAFMYFIEYSKSIKGKIAGICFTLITTVLIFTRTRGAWLGAFFATLYILIIIFRYRRELFTKFLKILFIVFIAIIILISSLMVFSKTREPIIEMTQTVVARFTSSLTVLQRILMWRVSLSAWADKPLFGHGLHSFKAFYSEYQMKYFEKYTLDSGNPPWEHWLSSSAIDFRHAHNDFVQFLSELGLLGFVAFCGFFAVSLYNGNKLLKENKAFYFNLGLNASLVCLAVEAFFNFPFHRAAPFLTAVIVMAAIQWQFRKEYEIKNKLNFSTLIIIIIISGAVMISGFTVGVKKARASVFHKAAHIDIAQRQNYERGEKLIEKSIMLDNSEGEAYYWYGFSVYAQNRLEEAELILNEALKFSNNKLIHLHLGLIALRNYEYEKALHHLTFIEYSDPTNSLSRYYKYVVYNSLMGKNPESEEYEDYKILRYKNLLNSVLLDKGNTPAINEAFFNEGLSGRDEEVKNKLFKHSDFSIFNKNQLFYLLQNFSAMLEDERKKELIELMIEKMDFDVNLKIRIIEKAIDFHFFDIALASLKEIIETNPNLAISYKLYGDILSGKGNSKEAQEYYKRYERFK